MPAAKTELKSPLSPFSKRGYFECVSSMITGQEIPLFGKLIMRHILLAGHGIEGAQGWWLSDPPLAKGEQGGFECVAGGFLCIGLSGETMGAV